MKTDTMRDFAVTIAWKMWGMPYIWGGDDPIDGYDCSGLAIEILKSVNLLPRKGDWTADGLYKMFNSKPVTIAKPGCLVLWGNPRKTHIEFVIREGFTIGASGGGSRTMTREDAIRQNAYVKIRPIATRSTPSALVDPFEENL
jgi:cell wall-associated NlpC family hydrolase